MIEQSVDSRYYEVVKSNSLSERVLIAARDRIFSDFIKLCSPAPADRLLDVGVSDVISEGTNLIERKYPYPAQLTACGLGPGDAFRRRFPEISYIRIQPNTRLPFADQEFAIATSNAVLEHVGSVELQKRFVAELARVAKTVFITVPNRFFPIEHHTAFPIVHWADATFRAACAIGKKHEWAKPENLILMTRKRLIEATSSTRERAWRTGYTGLTCGPFSSNLYLYSEG